MDDIKNNNIEKVETLSTTVDTTPLKDEVIADITPIDITAPYNQTRVMSTLERVQDIMDIIQGPHFPDLKQGKFIEYNHLVNQMTTPIVNSTNNTDAQWNIPHFPWAGISFKYSGSRTVKRKKYPLVDTLYSFTVTNSPERGLNLAGRALPGAISKYSAIFQGWTYDSAKKNPPYKPLAQLLTAAAYTPPSSNPPTLTIIKISTLANNIANRTPSFGTNVAFPEDVVFLDLSSLTNANATTLGKLGLFGSRIVDMSDQVASANVNFTSRTQLDPVLMRVCEDTLLKSDKEWCLFDVLPYIPKGKASAITSAVLTEEIPTYDPVEALFSWICKTNYESFDISLTKLSNNTTTVANMKYRTLFQTIRMCKTYLHQQAGKMVNIIGNVYGGDSDIDAAWPLVLYNIDPVTLPPPIGTTDSVATFAFSWIPNECPASENVGIELDDSDNTFQGATGYAVSKEAIIYPRTSVYIFSSSTTINYYNRKGNTVQFYQLGSSNALMNTQPIDIEAETIGGGINNNYRINNTYLGRNVINYKKPSTYDDSFLNVKIKKAWRK